MATIVQQRDLVVTLKKETILNIRLISKLQPLSTELRSILKENALDKPTQNLFNKLTYYLVSIIDTQMHAALTWPLYDTAAERTYRNELYNFISEYSASGHLSPVMCSYLVNPGCFKVTVLIFQLSQLAVNRLLSSLMVKDSKKILYNTMTERYKSQEKDDFVKCIEKETEVMLSKFSNYLHKRKVMEDIAMLFRKKIIDMEKLLSTTNAQGFIDMLVDNYIRKYEVENNFKNDLLKIKNVNEQPLFFNNWLQETDKKLDNLEDNWNTKIKLLLEKSSNIVDLTEIIVNQNTGQVEKKSYTVEYDPKCDQISTTDLQNQVNSEQKYILCNLEKDGRLNFPNLIRAFVISVCYILKNNEMNNDIYKFNEYLIGTKRNYAEAVSALKTLLQRVLNAESKLQSAPVIYNQSISFKHLIDLPPLPDLSELKTNKDQYQVFYDIFTPLNLSRHQFNLRRRTSGTFVKPQPKSLITSVPFNQAHKDDFLKSLISCRRSAYDTNMLNNNNISVISDIKSNETIAECSGFTKQQIFRLLSTKKSSSSKKFKYKQDRPDIKIKKGGLFNESISLNGSNILFRSYSSPNLFEHKEKRSLGNIRGRKLSIMREDSPQLEVSGITCLDSDSNCNTPHGLGNAESSRKLDTSNFPLTVDNAAVIKINEVLETFKVDFINEMDIVSPILEVSRKGTELPVLEVSRKSTELPILEVSRKSTELPVLEVSRKSTEFSRTETPKNNSTLIRKTNSLEKIINRFKKVRDSIMPQKNDEIQTISEEKENHFVNANRILLPDLLSPSCSATKTYTNINDLDHICLDTDKVEKGPRESLGAVLGVDQTFLDQFNLID